jgi:hypothetical protein
MMRKSQATVEFLLTYGWVVLAVLVVIAALSYFGVLNPFAQLPEKCVVPAGFVCVDHVVSDEGVMVRLQNGAGKDAVIKKIIFSSSALAGNCSTGVIVGFLKAGDTKNFVAADPAACGAVGGGVNKYKVEVEYSWLDSYTITHKGFGDLVSAVDAGAELGSGDYGGYGDLVGYWKFDDGTGVSVSDSTGNNDATFYGESFNDGTINGASWASGKYGSGLSFDGVDDYVDAGDDASLDITGSLTVELWAKLNSHSSTTELDYAGKYRGVGDRSWALYIGRTDNLTTFGVWNASDNAAIATSDSILSANAWQHLVGVFDSNSGEVALYVDGVKQSTTGTLKGTINSTSINVKIGKTDANYYFNGSIDEVRIYNKALTQAEIQESMNSAYPIIRPVASWSFNEGSGGTAYDAHNWVKGKSGTALSFDGVDDGVRVPDSPSISITGNMTAAFWVKRDGYATSCGPAGVCEVISKRVSSDGFIVSISNADRKPTFIINPWGNEVISDVVLENGAWYFVAARYNGTHLSIFVSGTWNHEETAQTSINPNNDPLWIGASRYSRGINGSIDEVRIWSRALTEQEISSLYSTEQ